MTGGGDVAKRAFEAMMEMDKIDVAKIEAAMHGEAVLRIYRKSQSEGRNIIPSKLGQKDRLVRVI